MSDLKREVIVTEYVMESVKIMKKIVSNLSLIIFNESNEMTKKFYNIFFYNTKGTNLIGLSKCAEHFGFNCQAVKVDREGFLSRYTLPVILNVYKYSIVAYHGYINGSYHRCDTVSDEPKAFCGNCNDDNHKYSAGIYI